MTVNRNMKIAAVVAVFLASVADGILRLGIEGGAALALGHDNGRPGVDGQDVRMRAVEQLLDGRGDREILEVDPAGELPRRHAEELRARNEELTRFNHAAVDRELRMIQLKERINELSLQAGQPPPYALDFLTSKK